MLTDPPDDAHALLCTARLAAHLPDRQTAAALTGKIAATLPHARFFIAQAPVTKYGLTPLHFAPSPGAPLRELFTKEQIDGQLESLLERQEEDGGWPVDWTLPSPAARSEWRGKVTLDALSVLVAYGRIEVC